MKNSFPGYEYVIKKDKDGNASSYNMYKGFDVGKGGFVFSKPGIYKNVAVLDVQSMHPTSMIVMNYYGEYTKRFKELIEARIAIKHGDYETAGKMFDGKLMKYLTSKEDAEALGYALKIAGNSTYGLTASNYQTPFKDNRNINNIVALRGALFMVDLKEAIEEKGFEVVHIKTDSAKVPNATKEIIQFMIDFAAEYGYSFEHEETYEKMCLVDDANLIAKRIKPNKKGELWEAVGTEFQYPFVFKTLFSKEEIVFDDLCETKSVKGKMFLDFNENLGKDEHNYVFIGKVGCFCPVIDGCNGGILVKDSSLKAGYDAVVGTKGWRWMEREIVLGNEYQDRVNYDFFHAKVEAAKKRIAEFGNVEEFLK